LVSAVDVLIRGGDAAALFAPAFAEKGSGFEIPEKPEETLKKGLIKRVRLKK